MRFRRWLSVAFLPLLTAAALLGGVRALTTRWSRNQQLSRSGDVRMAIDHVTDVVVDAETAQRGYLLTGDRAYLRAYAGAVSSWPGRVEALRRLTASSAEQQNRAAALENLISAKLAELAETMRAHDEGLRGAMLADRLNRGRALMADIRRVSAEMQVEQERMMAERADTMHRRMLRSLALFIASSIALMAMTIVISVRRARAEERASEREVSMRFADQFIGILGHDLRNPLLAVTMGAKLLERALEGPEREISRRIVRSSARMDRMIAQILDFARSRGGGGIPVWRAPTNMSEVVSNVIDELEMAHPDRRIEWERGHRDVCATCDADRVAQMVSNLVANALLHGDRARPVHVTLRHAREHIVLEVQNWGPPIDPELVPVLFEPYRHGGPTSRSTGLGLGLFITREIARAHGGNVHVRSTAAEGTAFVVELPC